MNIIFFTEFVLTLIEIISSGDVWLRLLHYVLAILLLKYVKTIYDGS